MARYIEVPGAWYIEIHLSYNIHGRGIIAVPGILRLTVYRGTVYRGFTVSANRTIKLQ